jgi:glycosyltransferase involved in cell wall biosynthesis
METPFIKSDKTDTVVLVPHYNDPDGLTASLRSIARSSVPVDVLVVDDGSVACPDETDLRKINPACTLLRSIQNEGIEHALNRGLSFILKNPVWRYVARLDCGDLCHSDRFRAQRDHLDAHPETHLCGTWVRFIDPDGNLLWNFCPAVDDAVLRKRMFLNNMFCHPAVMIRTETFRHAGLYPTGFPRAEDYALFFNILRRFRVANLPEFLVDTVYTAGGISARHRRAQINSRIRIIARHFDFSFWAFYGLLRNIGVWILPVKLSPKLKTLFKRSG